MAALNDVKRQACEMDAWATGHGPKYRRKSSLAPLAGRQPDGAALSRQSGLNVKLGLMSCKMEIIHPHEQ